jgi:dihydroxyacetone kinase
MPVICDDPTTFADEAIEGFVAANSDGVVRVDGGVVREAEKPAG